MKRLIIVASLAILAVGCQKTFVQNEVQTPIGFSTEVGKQTRAIVDGTTYDTNQPFGVYAYGHQGANDPAPSEIMVNVEIFKDGNDWKATDGFTYYWPNDPETTINFYAYSPVLNTASNQKNQAGEVSLASHLVMEANDFEHSEDDGLSFTGYIHSNPYVDFMEATPIEGATFSNPDGEATGTSLINGQVPLTFNHKMTQVVFNVTTDKVYKGVTFTLKNITLKNVKDKGSYSNGDWTSAFSVNEVASRRIYTVFPADSDNGADLTDRTLANDATLEADVVLQYAADATQKLNWTSVGVTMIPQDMATATTNPTVGADSYVNETDAQMFAIEYVISGKGVATETVIKHVPFLVTGSTAVNWGPNKKIIYNVQIGLKEITFDPEVATWSNTYDHDDDDDTPEVSTDTEVNI